MKNLKLEGTLAGTVLVIATYLFLNSSLNLLNKWALGHTGFRFPFLLTSCHMAFQFTVLGPVAVLQPWETHRSTLSRQWRGILCLGSFLALNVALTNVSLQAISLSLSQIIRAAIPVVVCVLGILIESKYPTRQEAVSLVVLSLGVMLAVWQGSATGQPWAIGFAIAATFSAASMMVFASKLMSEKLDVVRLAFYMSPICLAILLPLYLIYEHDTFRDYWPTNQHTVSLIVGLTSINALCYNLIHALAIKQLSAVTVTVLGEVKIIALLVLSTLLLGEGSEFTPKMLAGTGLALVGFGAYSHVRISQGLAGQPQEAAQPSSSSNGSRHSHEQQRLLIIQEALPTKSSIH